jgi:hypothetical protein
VLSSPATDFNLVALLAPKIRTLLAIVPATSVFMLRGDEFVAHGRDCLDQQSATHLVKVSLLGAPSRVPSRAIFSFVPNNERGVHVQTRRAEDGGLERAT